MKNLSFVTFALILSFFATPLAHAGKGDKPKTVCGEIQKISDNVESNSSMLGDWVSWAFGWQKKTDDRLSNLEKTIGTFEYSGSESDGEEESSNYSIVAPKEERSESRIASLENRVQKIECKLNEFESKMSKGANCTEKKEKKCEPTSTPKVRERDECHVLMLEDRTYPLRHTNKLQKGYVYFVPLKAMKFLTENGSAKCIQEEDKIAVTIVSNHYHDFIQYTKGQKLQVTAGLAKFLICNKIAVADLTSK